MKLFLLRWLTTTLAVGVAVQLTGMRTEGWLPLIATALLLGIINAFVRPVLLLLSLPFVLVTLGLFILVLNAIFLALAGGLIPGFHVGGFGNAFFGAIIVSLVSSVLNGLIRGNDGRYHMQAPSPRPEIKQVQGRVVE
ncbi:MAG TPA: phage holin family protein [Chthoniobacteraceae bacterium]|jgi:putative membrane protein|nr:Membrane protein of unknown function [Chthoniobacter sp.]HEV7866682.1 phage holin family protein [Chthoniobacteraceae bacterium]